MIDLVLRGQALLIFLLGCLTAIGGWMLRAHILQLVGEQTASKASAKAVEEIDVRMNAHASRLSSIEAALRHLPTAEQLHALNLLIAGMGGDLRAMREKVEGIEKQLGAQTRRLEMMDEHLRAERAR